MAVDKPESGRVRTLSGQLAQGGHGLRASWPVLLLLLVPGFVIGLTSLASAATISGTITDHSTGAPIPGAEVTVDLVSAGEGEAAGLEVGRPIAYPETDAGGHWETQGPAGTYWIFAKAPGYFWQGVGAPTGNNGTVELKVGDAGLAIDTQMVPDNSPFLGLFPTTMRWSNNPKEGFRSMVLFMEYGGFAAIPSGWSEQHLVTEIVDGAGRPVWPKEMTKTNLVPPGGEGEGAPSQEFGSSGGCEFYNSTKERPDVEHLRVLSYLESNPSIRVEEAITPDFSECAKTRLKLWHPQIEPGRRIKMLLAATIEDRLPEGEKVPGVLRFVVNGHKPIYVRVKDATELDFTAKGSRLIHPGKNKVVASFAPSSNTLTAPASKHLIFRASRAAFRHYYSHR